MEGEERQGLGLALIRAADSKLDPNSHEWLGMALRRTHVRNSRHSHAANSSAGIEVPESAHTAPRRGRVLLLATVRGWWVGDVGDERVHCGVVRRVQGEVGESKLRVLWKEGTTKARTRKVSYSQVTVSKC